MSKVGLMRAGRVARSSAPTPSTWTSSAKAARSHWAPSRFTAGGDAHPQLAGSGLRYRFEDARIAQPKSLSEHPAARVFRAHTAEDASARDGARPVVVKQHATPAGGATLIQRQTLTTQAECDAAYDLCVAGCRGLRTKLQRRLCYERCMEEYARCLKHANRDTPDWLLFLVIVAAIVLVAADGPFPIGDAAAAALLLSFGLFDSSTADEAAAREGEAGTSRPA